MPTILHQIVAQKRREIKALYEQYDLDELRRHAQSSEQRFYQILSNARAAGEPFFITEFKRKSPSEGWINRDADVAQQISQYIDAGAQAISILTDSEFFGGSYADLHQAYLAVDHPPSAVHRPPYTVYRPLLLQKDFVLDPIQVYLARQNGADIILLIAAILEPEQLVFLKKTAESLGMGVLVEVHDFEEFEKIRHLDFPVLGVNNRDLKTFRTALNRVNTIAPHAGGRLLIAESGVKDYRDFQVVKNADGFLIGTGLMQAFPPLEAGEGEGNAAKKFTLSAHFQSAGRLLFKACGIRTPQLLQNNPADFTGINFSPLSNRKIHPKLLEKQSVPSHAVAVFFKNTESEILKTLAKYPFKIVQLYADDVTPEFVRSLRQKVFLACRVRSNADLQQLENFAPDVDLFILDGAQPGSGQAISTFIPEDFPYPFLLAGGLHAGNLRQLDRLQNCIGVDIASGIETNGHVDAVKVWQIPRILNYQNQVIATDTIIQ